MRKSKEKNMKAIDFFCGAGGLSCGFKQAGIKILGGIDIDKSFKETYENNIKSKFLHSNISDIDEKTLSKEFNIDKNQDELIFVGCSPCQFYSNIKTDKTKSGETRLLLEDFQEFVGYFDPGYVFIENVPGFDKNGESPLGRFKSFLINQGYAYKDGVLNAKYYGVPQNRRRYVLLASKNNKQIRLPAPDKKNVKTVITAIGDQTFFKPIKAGEIDIAGFMHSCASLSEINLKRILRTPKNGGDRRAWQDDPELQLECYKNHTGHYDVYGRMYWDKPSPAITTKFRYISNGRYGHPEQDRAISLREGATLQSFPLGYTFHSTSQTTIAKMIGNAVPPEFARRIGKTILENFNATI